MDKNIIKEAENVEVVKLEAEYIKIRKAEDKENEKLEDEKEKEDLVKEFYIDKASREEELENTEILLNAA